MTPCIARDGATALADDGRCVGCDSVPKDLLFELVMATGRAVGDRATDAGIADQLCGLVREVTEG